MGNPIKSAYITGHGRSGRWVVDHDDTHEKAYGVDVWSQYGWDKGTARSRGYYHRNDPKLQVFEGMDFELALAYNTDQLGRVFEDRTHRIAIRKPKEEVARDLRRRATMHNLNSRGKIGNFVETYPNFEYSFAPQKINAKVNDYVHIQFSGSDTNPSFQHSITEGDMQTHRQLRAKDRFNLAFLAQGESYKADPDSNWNRIFGFTEWDAYHLIHGGVSYANQDFALSDDKTRYVLRESLKDFDFGVRRFTTAGEWDFFSPLNTRFGARSQKGKIV